MNAYRSALSSYLTQIPIAVKNGNIIEPVRTIFWRAVMDQELTGRLLLEDAQYIRTITDQMLDTFVPLTQLAISELQAAGIKTRRFK